LRRYAGNPDGHYHVDCDDELLVLPSVFLNVRGPVEDFEHRLDEFVPPASTDLLPDMDWRDPALHDYEPLEAYEALYGRIPIIAKSLENG
jgi:hypothetical protein